MSDFSLSSLRAHYDAMWDRAWPHVTQGDVDCDRHLAGGLDPRRGLTLIARPGPALADGFARLQDRLAGAAPHQYRQPRADLHLTVLSLFTVTEDPAPHLARRADYAAAVRAAADGLPPFAIDFDGITISRGAVLARGFPRDGTLEGLRGMPLGTMHVDRLQLVVNDWYMSSAAVEVVETLNLRGHAA
jgi:hypothetical protein